jgi:ParB family chromosome partitioning protein
MGGVKTSASMGAEGRQDTWNFDPDNLIVPEKGSRLYDPDRAVPEESMIQSVMRRGVLKPVIIRKNGDRYEVIDGRQRVLAAREANRRFEAEGIDRRIVVPCVTRKVTDAMAYAIMVATNCNVRGETPMALARKLEEYLALGNSEEDAALDFAVDVATIRRWSKLLELDSDVQRKIESGGLSTEAGLMLVALPREQQVVKMNEMVANGTTHGEAGRHAARRATNGAGGKRRPPAKKMRSRRFVARCLKVMDEIDRAPATLAVVRGVLSYILEEAGVRDIENDLARQIVETAEQAGGTKE